MKTLPRAVFGVWSVSGVIWGLASVAVAQQPARGQAVDAMHRAVTFFRQNCSAGGGYVYRVSSDLKLREGEEKVGESTAWIQPPGTPAVGMAYLQAWQLTGDPLLRDAALETAGALIRGQLKSGGWDNLIEFATEDRRRYAYRVDGGSGSRLRNTTTFDDDKSQSALRFLMELDQAFEFSNPEVHEAVTYALDAFLKAQYPNGAWPQRYSEFPNPDEFPVKQASFPDQWPRMFPSKNYAGFYTLNDNTISDLIDTFLDAYDIYGDRRFLAAAKKGGDFFLLAQLPESQPGWAQQYDRDMHPAWARKFEPPAITGGESQGVMRTLMTLYRRTGDERYLTPIPAALAYYKKLVLPGGRLARFYEMGTDRPLYFTKQYELVYTSDDMPTHYAFIVGSSLDRIAAEYEELKQTPSEELWRPKKPAAPKLTSSLANRAQKVIAALDDRGAWTEPGRMRNYEDDSVKEVIDSRTFINNLRVLSEYVAAAK